MNRIHKVLFIAVLVFSFWIASAGTASAATFIKDGTDSRATAALNAIANQNFSGTGKTAAQVRDYIYHYMYVSKWKTFGGSTFPYLNSGSYTYSVSDGTYSASISGSKGCYAYADYVSMVVYGKTGSRKGESNAYTASTLKSFLQKEAQAGEHLRVDSKHSIVFISCADSGFYSLSYYGDSDPHIYFRYDTYEGFLSQYSGRKNLALQCQHQPEFYGFPLHGACERHLFQNRLGPSSLCLLHL